MKFEKFGSVNELSQQLGKQCDDESEDFWTQLAVIVIKSQTTNGLDRLIVKIKEFRGHIEEEKKELQKNIAEEQRRLAL